MRAPWPAALLLLAWSALSQAAEVACRDFLSALGHKPPYIEFLHCRQETERQGAPLTALYRVAGAQAANAEHHLAQTFGLEPLRRICCVWESPPHSFRDEHTGLAYLLSMTSAETTVGTRSRWRTTDYFYVQASIWTEESLDTAQLHSVDPPVAWVRAIVCIRLGAGERCAIEEVDQVRSVSRK